MSRLTPGQWLDLCTAVACTAYAVAVIMLPVLAPLAEHVPAEAAGGLAVGAFIRFRVSVHALKQVATAAALALVVFGAGCATLSKSVADTRAAVDKAERVVHRESSKNAGKARALLDSIDAELDELEDLADEVDAEARERREAAGL